MSNSDPYNLHRFVDAQANVYEGVLAELRNGSKQTHWMWFIFPQIEGLGHSSTSRYFSIKDQEEARCYLSHPVLGARLVECSGLVLAVNDRSARGIFGSPDDMKLKSSMTLFASVADSEPVFIRVLDKYFDGEQDGRTLFLLGRSIP